MSENPDQYLIQLATNQIRCLVDDEMYCVFNRKYEDALKVKKKIKKVFITLNKTYPNLTIELLLDVLNKQIKASRKQKDTEYDYSIKHFRSL